MTTRVLILGANGAIAQHVVSRKAVTAYIVSLVKKPEQDNRASVGVQKPGSEGDKPSFY